MNARHSRMMALLTLACGCGGGEPIRPVTVPFDQVPAGLVKVATKTLPRVKFDTARKFSYRGQEVYEIRGKEPGGRIREVEVSASGEVVEVE